MDPEEKEIDNWYFSADNAYEKLQGRVSDWFNKEGKQQTHIYKDMMYLWEVLSRKAVNIRHSCACRPVDK